MSFGNVTNLPIVVHCENNYPQREGKDAANDWGKVVNNLPSLGVLVMGFQDSIDSRLRRMSFVLHLLLLIINK